MFTVKSRDIRGNVASADLFHVSQWHAERIAALVAEGSQVAEAWVEDADGARIPRERLILAPEPVTTDDVRALECPFCEVHHDGAPCPHE
jgi:hypothetical protein